MANRWPRLVGWLALVMLAPLAVAAEPRPAADPRAGQAPQSEANLPAAESLPHPGQPAWQPTEPNWVEMPLGKTGESDEYLDSPQPAQQPPAWFRRFGARHQGMGQPLERESWLNRQLSVGVLMGGLWPDELRTGKIEAQAAFLMGVRFGWDYSHHFGFEGRLATTQFGLKYRVPTVAVSNANLFLFDSSVLYYPWGDSRIRPFFSVGMGLFDVKFTNELGTGIHESTFEMPIGMGVKYRYDNRIVFRFDFNDNMGFGSADRLDFTHNLSVTGGLELRLGGGPRKSYWPWNPSRTWW